MAECSGWTGSGILIPPVQEPGPGFAGKVLGEGLLPNEVVFA